MCKHILLYVQRIVARNNCYILFYGTVHCMLVTIFKDIVYMHITSVLITQTECYSSVILSSLHAALQQVMGPALL